MDRNPKKRGGRGDSDYEDFVQAVGEYLMGVSSQEARWYAMYAMAQCTGQEGLLRHVPSFTRSTGDDPLTLCYWNIEGLAKAKQETPVISSLVKFDILAFCETLCFEDETPEMFGFGMFTASTKKKDGSAGRPPGGLVIYYKKNKISNMTLIRSSTNFIFVKFALRTGKLCALCVTYRPPSTSKYEEKDYFTNVGKEVAAVRAQYPTAMILVVGDINARTAEQSELPPGSKIPARKSQDKAHSPQPADMKLITLCKEQKLVIVNGRVSGDLQGEVTYKGSSGGSSLIDYALVSMDDFERCLEMKVQPLGGKKHRTLVLKIKDDDGMASLAGSFPTATTLH